MNASTSDGFQEARRPIASLISKSEKARQKLAPGTWPHTMLGDNLKALHLASALMDTDANRAGDVSRSDLQAACRAFAAMIGKTGKAQEKFSPGTAQYTLLGNRLKALRIAQALTKMKLAGSPA